MIRKNILLLAIIALAVGFKNTVKNESGEILLIGVMHHIPDSLSCNWEPAKNKLIKFNPDQLSVEYVPAYDSASMIHYLGEDYKVKFDSLMLAWEGKKIAVWDSIAHYQFILHEKEDGMSRLKLWKFYYLSTDMANRDYQWYQIGKNWAAYEKLIDTSVNWMKILLRRQKSWMENSRENEFFNLVFPIAQNNQIDVVLPTDYRVTFPLQSKAYVAFDSGMSIKDRSVMESFWNRYTKAEKENLQLCKVLTLLNARQWLDTTDFGQTKVMKYMNNKDYTAYVEVWYKRNKVIADRIIEAVTKTGSKRMAVFYGNMHIYPVKKYLEEKGYKVKLLSDIQ